MERSELGGCAGWQAAREIGVHAPRACIVGGEKIRRAEALVELMEIGSASEDIVMRIGWIIAESVALLELHIGFGHDLHQSNRAGARGERNTADKRVAVAFGLHDAAYP